MKKYYVLIFFMAFSVPFFFGINAWQSNQCGALRNEIRRLERSQENSVENNKTVVAEIADLLAVDKLENDARTKLGLTKIRPEDVLLIILGGKGRGL